MSSESIDELLAHYLGLLHTYTELRGELASRQTSMYGNLARANFAAERGFRYGPEHFDGRMQALVRLAVSDSSVSGGEEKKQEPAATFAVVRPKKEAAKTADSGKDGEPKDGGEPKKGSEVDATNDDDDAGRDASERTEKKTKKAVKTPKGPRDPLQWFGVLTPMALRKAQQDAIAVVDDVVPRLASVAGEMAAVEIEVRRARKKRARAEAAHEKQSKQSTAAESTTDSAMVSA